MSSVSTFLSQRKKRGGSEWEQRLAGQLRWGAVPWATLDIKDPSPCSVDSPLHIPPREHHVLHFRTAGFTYWTCSYHLLAHLQILSTSDLGKLELQHLGSAQKHPYLRQLVEGRLKVHIPFFLVGSLYTLGQQAQAVSGCSAGPGWPDLPPSQSVLGHHDCGGLRCPVLSEPQATSCFPAEAHLIIDPSPPSWQTAI